MSPPVLLGQTVVVIGGSSGIGLETARRARAEGAELVLAGRDPDRLKRAATELGTSHLTAFDATDPAARCCSWPVPAAAAVHIMINTALDGATYDIDGGEQLVRDA
jgi:NADP-dependent 3-hydroxy acid dehydrogenase YdfG